MKKILVATDGSEPAKEAVLYAGKLAEKFGFSLVVLHVITSTHHGASHWLSIKRSLERELREKGDSVLTEAMEILEGRALKVELQSRFGSPHEEIIKSAREDAKVALVVVGAEGKGFATRRLLGSVTERVAREVSRKLPCPLLITPTKKKMQDARLTL
jgi:nucleotide-binding universal stress UspA family protein